ncbi:MAG: Wzz/FepE/Etk N-terminal domain-containing protein [Coriobacteriia bacterium]|nr:Wzz/FepE/Etk N-terminal domain-containing protein [Coriobacteriia bacterium]
MTLLDLLKLMRKNLHLMVALPIVFALVMASYAWFLMPNSYTASVSMYVLTTTTEGTSEGLTNSDLAASQMLTNDVARLIKSNRVLGDAAAQLSTSNLAGYQVDVASQTNTRVLTLSVTGSSAQSVAIIANELARTTDRVAKEIMDVRSVNVIDEALEPKSPSGPPRLMYTMVAFFVGIAAAIALVILKDLLNTRVRDISEIEELLGAPVIGQMPVMKDRG